MALEIFSCIPCSSTINQMSLNVDFPTWMIESLDREAGRLGVTRQSIIKVWLAERLEQRASNKSSKKDAVTGASS